MLTLGAFAFLLVSVFGSYLVSGGSIEVLAEALPFEMWTIGGAAVAAFVMANSMHELKHSVGKFKKIFSGAAYSKSDYVDLLSLLYSWCGWPAPRATWRSSRTSKIPRELRIPEVSQGPRQPFRQHDDLRLPAHGRHERRRSQPDRRLHGARAEEDAERGAARRACAADDGRRTARARDRRGGARCHQDDVAYRSAAGDVWAR